jgi:hypothetical protein
MRPLLRLGRGEGAHGRGPTAGVPQGAHDRPRLGGDGLLALFVSGAAVREDDHRTWIIGAERLFHLSRLDVLYAEVMLGAILPLRLPARALARARDGTKRSPPGMEEPHAMGPRMPNDPSLPLLDRVGVCWRQPGATLERPRHAHRQMPGPRVPLVPGVGNVLGLLLGQALQRSDGDRALGFHPLRALGGVPSGEPGGFRERLLRGHAHQKEEGARTDVLKTETHEAMTGDPSLHRLRSPGASPGSRWRCGARRIRARGAAEGASRLCTSREGWSTDVSLPVIRKRGGDGRLHDARAARGDATGRWILPLLAPCRSRKPCLLGIPCFSVLLGTSRAFRKYVKYLCISIPTSRPSILKGFRDFYAWKFMVEYLQVILASAPLQWLQLGGLASVAWPN